MSNLFTAALGVRFSAGFLHGQLYVRQPKLVLFPLSPLLAAATAIDQRNPRRDRLLGAVRTPSYRKCAGSLAYICERFNDRRQAAMASPGACQAGGMLRQRPWRPRYVLTRTAHLQVSAVVLIQVSPVPSVSITCRNECREMDVRNTEYRQL